MSVLQLHLAALQRALHRPAEVGELDGLGEVIHRPALHAQGGTGSVVDGGEHQDGEIGLGLDRVRHEIHTAGAWHPDVAQHESDAVPLQLGERLLPRRGRVHLELLLRHELLQGVADGFLVVHHEDGDRAHEIRHGEEDAGQRPEPLPAGRDERDGNGRRNQPRAVRPVQ